MYMWDIYSIEYSGIVTLCEYSDVYGDILKLGVKERTSSSIDTCASPGSKTLWSIDVFLVYLHLFGCELSGN